MAYTYDLTSERGQLRLLITDTDHDNPIFQDNEIDFFLNNTAVDGTNDVNLAGAKALETIAASETLVQKKMKLLDITTDGPAVAKSLREAAALLREQSESEGDIDVIEQNLNVFSAREIIWNDAIRTQ